MSYFGHQLERLIDRIRPMKPYDFLRSQPEPLAKLLPYESVIQSGDHTLMILSDGSLGIMWELTQFSHETMSSPEMEALNNTLGRILSEINHPEVSLQVMFMSEPSQEMGVSAYFQDPITSSQQIIAQRIKEVQSLAKNPKENLCLIKRRTVLTLRLLRPLGFNQNVSEGEGAVKGRFLALKAEIIRLAKDLENSLSYGEIKFKGMDGEGIFQVLRGIFHERDFSLEKNLSHKSRFSDQILQDFVALTPNAVKVGGDTWEVASWADQPPSVYPGIMAQLMTIDLPIRLILCVRPCFDKSDLDRKSFLLRRAEDPEGELQRDDVRDTLESLAKGKSLSYASIYLWIRGMSGMSGSHGYSSDHSLALLSKLKNLTQISWILEKYAAPALFFFSMPFGFSKNTAKFSGREKRVMSKNLGPYVPIYGSFTGTKKELQLMVSRGGSPTWLSPFASETSPHMAVLASSGGGKSFFAENLMMSFFAQSKDPLLFIIDKKTSYEVFAHVIGEDHGYQVIKPPKEYPNIFRGKLDEFRLPVIVGLIKSAISLVSKDFVLGATEEMLISDSVRMAFEERALDSETEYDAGILKGKAPSEVKIPRLSDIKDNLFTAAALSGVSQDSAQRLAEAMAPFINQGPYASLFDRDEYDAIDPATPGVSLYDIDLVGSHPVLSTLTTQMILSEILRQICRKENVGRPGMLVIEEAGVLAGASTEIVSFIQDAWKTFRKLGIICVGLTNEVDDYRVKPGPREIWNVSPNKVILKMLAKDVEKARDLIGNPHHISLIGSLTKKDGVYSQGLFISDEVAGTFVYMPTGYDYWCAASKPIEVETVFKVADLFKLKSKPFFEAVSWLAAHYPRGVRNALGDLRELDLGEVTG